MRKIVTVTDEAPSPPRPARIAAWHPVLLRSRGEHPEGAFTDIGRMLDVSETGLLLQTAHRQEIGAELDLEIATTGQLLFARGVVIRVRADDGGGFELGLAWTGIPTEGLAALLYP